MNGKMQREFPVGSDHFPPPRKGAARPAFDCSASGESA